MSITTPRLGVPELEQLAAEYTKRAEAVAADVERMDEIKQILRDQLSPGTHDLAGVKVQVRQGARRLNSKALAEAFPVAEHVELYSLALDTAKVKDNLSPAVLRDFQTQAANTVVIQ